MKTTGPLNYAQSKALDKKGTSLLFEADTFLKT